MMSRKMNLVILLLSFLAVSSVLAEEARLGAGNDMTSTVESTTEEADMKAGNKEEEESMDGKVTTTQSGEMDNERKEDGTTAESGGDGADGEEEGEGMDGKTTTQSGEMDNEEGEDVTTAESGGGGGGKGGGQGGNGGGAGGSGGGDTGGGVTEGGVTEGGVTEGGDTGGGGNGGGGGDTGGGGGKPEVSGELKLSGSFTPALSDTESDEFKNLKQTTQKNIKNAFEASANVTSVSVTGFRSGSILADFTVVFSDISDTSVTNAGFDSTLDYLYDVVTTTFEKAAANGTLEIESFELIPVTTMAPLTNTKGRMCFVCTADANDGEDHVCNGVQEKGVSNAVECTANQVCLEELLTTNGLFVRGTRKCMMNEECIGPSQNDEPTCDEDSQTKIKTCHRCCDTDHCNMKENWEKNVSSAVFPFSLVILSTIGILSWLLG
ncbi:uncharacterized protein [Amphiura filiformis]|uniref:uncharacterized protein n=1 Tax=Amphiura filiformis TaxID=82378 RepID=UPI003B20CBBD